MTYHKIETARVEFFDGEGVALCAMHPGRNIGMIWHGGIYADITALDEDGLPTDEPFAVLHMWHGTSADTSPSFDEETVRAELAQAMSDSMV